MNNRLPVGARVRAPLLNNEYRSGTIVTVLDTPYRKRLQIIFDGKDTFPYTYGDWAGDWSIASIMSDVLKDTLETTTPEVTHDHP